MWSEERAWDEILETTVFDNGKRKGGRKLRRNTQKDKSIPGALFSAMAKASEIASEVRKAGKVPFGFDN